MHPHELYIVQNVWWWWWGKVLIVFSCFMFSMMIFALRFFEKILNCTLLQRYHSSSFSYWPNTFLLVFVFKTLSAGTHICVSKQCKLLLLFFPEMVGVYTSVQQYTNTRRRTDYFENALNLAASLFIILRILFNGETNGRGNIKGPSCLA